MDRTSAMSYRIQSLWHLQTSPCSRHLGKTCYLRTAGSHWTREHTKGPLIKQVILEAAAALGADPNAPMQLAILDNEIAEANYKQSNEVPIKMSDSEMTQYNKDWKTYWERNVLLMKHRGQTFSLILGHCTQLLQDRMKQDTNWNMASTSYDPLDLYRLIKKMMLAQTENLTKCNDCSGFLM